MEKLPFFVVFFFLRKERRGIYYLRRPDDESPLFHTGGGGRGGVAGSLARDLFICPSLRPCTRSVANQKCVPQKVNKQTSMTEGADKGVHKINKKNHGANDQNYIYKKKMKKEKITSKIGKREEKWEGFVVLVVKRIDRLFAKKKKN